MYFLRRKQVDSRSSYILIIITVIYNMWVDWSFFRNFQGSLPVRSPYFNTHPIILAGGEDN